MSDTIRFYLDEHIDHAIRDGLRRRNVEVITPLDIDRVGDPDEDQLAYALEEGLVIVTHDKDFLILHAQGILHAGIAYCKTRKRSIGEIIEYLELMVHALTPEEMQNHVEYF